MYTKVQLLRPCLLGIEGLGKLLGWLNIGSLLIYKSYTVLNSSLTLSLPTAA